MNPRFSLGIDLGTSNCAMAVADNDSDSTDVLPVTQIVAANRVGEMRTLPSALYLPHPEEFPGGSFRLPWDAAGPHQPFGYVVARIDPAHQARSYPKNANK